MIYSHYSVAWRQNRPKCITERYQPAQGPIAGIETRSRQLRAPLESSAGWPTESQTFRRTGAIERSEEHTSELQSLRHLVCRLLLEKKKKIESRELEIASTRKQ